MKDDKTELEFSPYMSTSIIDRIETSILPIPEGKNHAVPSNPCFYRMDVARSVRVQTRGKHNVFFNSTLSWSTLESHKSAENSHRGHPWPPRGRKLPAYFRGRTTTNSAITPPYTTMHR